VTVVDLRRPADPAVPHAIADVRDVDGLVDAIGGSAETIVNLAAVHRDDVRPRSLYNEVNVGGARACCEAARRVGARTIMFTSSVAVYGFSDREIFEDAPIAPFNDYGRTKAEAEDVYRAWQAEDPHGRRLVVVRPTVVFGEGNRGNVYALMRQIASLWFVMVGDGSNRKSIAYVENLVAFLVWTRTLGPGLHVFNYVDKPDLDMNQLVATIRRSMGERNDHLRVPYALALPLGAVADLAARILRRPLPISTIRLRKFVSSSVYGNGGARTGFDPPVGLEEALTRMLRHEFPDRCRSVQPSTSLEQDPGSA